MKTRLKNQNRMEKNTAKNKIDFVVFLNGSVFQPIFICFIFILHEKYLFADVLSQKSKIG